MDIVGVASHSLKDYDSNIGSISTHFGGVGRNIAQSCVEMGESVMLVTCFGCDDYGKLLKEHCDLVGIDTSFSIESSTHGTSVYMAILDEERDMRIALSDMSVLTEIKEEVVSKAIKEMSSDDILVIDSNLDAGLIDFISKSVPARIASDPVSAAKIPRLERFLDRIGIFKPNEIEARELTGITIKDDETARRSLEWFLERGIEEIIITLGSRGILFGNSDKKVWLTHKTVEMDNANGGGDALFGAYLSMRNKGEDPIKALEVAIAVAILKITGEFNSHNMAAYRLGVQVSEEERKELHAKRKQKIAEEIKTLDIKEREL